MKTIRILIVSENSNMIKSVLRVGESIGAHVEEVVSVKNGVEKILSEDFDYAFIDISLSPVQGIEDLVQVSAGFLIKLIHDIKPGAHIVAVSGAEGHEMEAKIRSLGISYLITYPFDENELKTLLKKN